MCAVHINLESVDGGRGLSFWQEENRWKYVKIIGNSSKKRIKIENRKKKRLLRNYLLENNKIKRGKGKKGLIKSNEWRK